MDPTKYFNDHVNYLMAGDLDTLVNEQYTDESVLITPADLLETPPPHILRGKAAIKAFLRRWLDYHGTVNVTSLTNFVETEDSISFHLTLTSQTGNWMMGEAWHVVGGLDKGKIDRHYTFVYKIGE